MRPRRWGGGNADKHEPQCGLATGEPIKVGAITTASGGVDFSSSPNAAAAYFDCVNDNGGINGRPIEYSFQDDELDPAKTAQLAAGYAADESIVGLVGDSTFIGGEVANAEYVKGDLYSITAPSAILDGVDADRGAVPPLSNWAAVTSSSAGIDRVESILILDVDGVLDRRSQHRPVEAPDGARQQWTRSAHPTC